MTSGPSLSLRSSSPSAVSWNRPEAPSLATSIATRRRSKRRSDRSWTPHSVARSRAVRGSTIRSAIPSSTATPRLLDCRNAVIKRHIARLVSAVDSGIDELSSSDEKASVLHDVPTVHRDRRVRCKHVDMRWALPVGSGLEAIGIAERDMDARKLLILQEVANNLGKPDVGADRKLTHAARIRILRHVVANVGRQLHVRGLNGDDAPALHHETDRRGQHPV